MVTKPNESVEPVEIETKSGEVEVETDALAQWAFTAPFEGVVPHLYLDTRGNVTCGVGFLIATKSALDGFDWEPDVLTARADYDRVRAADRTRVHVAAFYKQFCTAHLTESTMRAHFDAHVTSVTGQLGGWGLVSLPRNARVALIDMAFNLGVGGLNKYKKLQAAVFARDWAQAAGECSRKGIQAARNDATRDLFLSLVAVV